MPKAPYKDVIDKAKAMRKSKLLSICKEELSDEEMEVFLLRVYGNYYRERTATEVHKCKETVSSIWMRAIRKLRELFEEMNNV